MEINEIRAEHEHASTSLKVVLLIFAIFLIGVLAYLVWATNTAPDTTDNSAAVTKKTTTNATANWKTYANADLGFSVKYPSTFATDFMAETSTLSIDDPALAKPNPLAMINVSSSTKTLDQFIADLKANTSVTEEVKTTLDNIPAFEGIDTGIISQYGLYSVANGKAYTLTFPTNNTDTLAELKTGLTTTQKSIIASFKFTK